MRPPFNLVLWAFVILSVFATEGFTSGGAEIDVTHDYLQVSVATPRKRPMPGDEAEYAKRMTEWEKANRPLVDKAVAAIEAAVLPRYRKALAAKRFTASSFKDLTSEGTVRPGGADDAAWRLTVDLDLFPGGSISSVARFVFETRPTKTEVRAFSRDVQAAALKSLGRSLPPSPTYTAYWLTPDTGAPSLLLTTVPLAKLQGTLEKAPWSQMGFETFRRAPALLLTTDEKKFLVRNSAGFLLANPTAAKIEPGATSVALQVNGSYLPAMIVKPAARADVVKLLDNPVDPALGADDKKRLEDDLEFLATLKPSLAK